MIVDELNSIYKEVKSPLLYGRYITNDSIENCLKKYPQSAIKTIGLSVKKRPIYGITFGNGSIKILLWSQMHGNETTTTKAIFDCFNLFQLNNEISKQILKSCTLHFIPILNPDGAEYYTRFNANNIDLNRDAQDLSQPESKILRNYYNVVKPDVCFNLHGQRTIFGVGNLGVPATLSFLSPSQNKERTLTSNRKISMSIIANINNELQHILSDGIGRYDDDFNINCVGDTFQNFGTPTILFEAGHYPNDYKREEVRRFLFFALIIALNDISVNFNRNLAGFRHYFDIPENSKSFFDIIIRNARLTEADSNLTDIAIQYKENLKKGEIYFSPTVESIGQLNNFYGHKIIDAKEQVVKNERNFDIQIGNENDFVLINNKKIALKP